MEDYDEIKRIISFGLAAVLSCGLLAGCGNLSNDEDTIKIMLSGTKPTGWDRVLESMRKQVQRKQRYI